MTTLIYSPLSAEHETKLRQLRDQLLRWNDAFNLTAIRDPDEAWRLHILDSLSLAPLLTGPNLLDVGTGPGFPALPLALTHPEIKVTALDSNNKKIRFIRQMAHELQIANIEPVQARVEDFQGQFAQITSRAFTELKGFIACTEHLLAPGGEWLAMKSARAETEIAALPVGYTAEIIDLSVPGLTAYRCVVRVRRA